MRVCCGFVAAGWCCYLSGLASTVVPVPSMYSTQPRYGWSAFRSFTEAVTVIVCPAWVVGFAGSTVRCPAAAVPSMRKSRKV